MDVSDNQMKIKLNLNLKLMEGKFSIFQLKHYQLESWKKGLLESKAYFIIESHQIPYT